MVRYVIDRLSESDIAKYRERSVKAINGIQMLLSNPSIVLDKPTIYGKYLTIAAYIGLVTENNKSAYNNFIPTNSNNLFLLRFSDHDNTNPQLYDVHEQMGRPNARNIICFSYNDIEAKNGEWNETRHIVVPYGENALDNEDSIISFLYALSRLFIDGETNYPLLPITNQDDGHMSPNDEINQWNRTIDKNNETNESKNMKNTIKLNESQLRKVIAESVKKVLNEDYSKTKTQELAETIGKKIDEITNLVQLDFANALLADYGKGSEEYTKGMEIRSKMISLAGDLKAELHPYFQHYDFDYERIGY